MTHSPLLSAMTLLAAEFFEANRRKPTDMTELCAPRFHGEENPLSDSEQHFAQAFCELWDAVEALVRNHPSTYQHVFKVEDVEVTPALKLKDPSESGCDYVLDDTSGAVWIETPNALVSLFFDDAGDTTTVVRIYDSKEDVPPKGSLSVTGVITPDLQDGKWHLYEETFGKHPSWAVAYSTNNFAVGFVTDATAEDRTFVNGENIYLLPRRVTPGVGGLNRRVADLKAVLDCTGSGNANLVIKVH